MKRIYIAGPMTGYPSYNFPAFDAADRALTQAGWETLNPAQMDRDEGFDPDRDTPTREWLDEAMQRDLDALMAADAIALLPGWEESTGAKGEYGLAKWRHIPAYSLPDMREIDARIEIVHAHSPIR